ncbi:fibrinogen C domain-containing protein 1 [Austrofundulus limnaeus]|uniref:Fibrinogen C domain-containing protein 1 n=1 Tax=Austrofundulus limnaeus TaxID=52670 RepID=A0A2I4CUC1_AUSLI|nr:PREDICTED: fibrinogen C domain-containing protein 1 [Austrofundulus limnaeus]XP_013883593.1 PREDICTED: fibrinogen C domain-containing protein 1 [Austrofundulus limnaeus]
MMLNDRWTIMNNSSSELDTKRPQRKRCRRFLLWSVVVVVVTAAIVTSTVVILYLNHYPLPFISRGGVSSPVVSTNTKDSGALVTVSRAADGEPISIFLDPNCPDFTEHFLRWEALQSSLLRTLTNHNTEEWQERGLVQKLTDELKVLTGHAHNLRLEDDSLKRGQGVLDQRMTELQGEQSRIIQVLSENHAGVLKLAEGFRDSLVSLKQETESLRKLKSELGRELTNTAVRPKDCSDILASGVSQDGVYSVFPTHDPNGFMVYCDMSTEGGGWTVIQRREDGSVNFFRGWEAYRDGFGTITGEHWLGLQRIYALTRSGGFELRIDMADFDNATAFAQYSEFSVGRDSVNPEEDGYPLTVDGYSGTAGDSLLKHSGMRFTTKDRDQDQSENNCAAYYQGAWWYRNCHTSNLNGQYLRGGHASYADGVEWSSWTGWQYSLRFTEMKIRPRTPES